MVTTTYVPGLDCHVLVREVDDLTADERSRVVGGLVGVAVTLKTMAEGDALATANNFQKAKDAFDEAAALATWLPEDVIDELPLPVVMEIVDVVLEHADETMFDDETRANAQAAFDAAGSGDQS